MLFVGEHSPPLVRYSVLVVTISTSHRLPTDSSQGGPYYIPATGVLVLSGASSGMYTCTGMNQLGMDSQTITITIVGQSEWAPYVIIPINAFEVDTPLLVISNQLIGYVYDLPVFEYEVCNFILMEGAVHCEPQIFHSPPISEFYNNV